MIICVIMMTSLITHERARDIEPCDKRQLNESLIQSVSGAIGFIEEHLKRLINGVYFDDELFSSYWENKEGVTRRTKLRLRWYGGTVGGPVFVKLNPKVEI